MPTNKELEEQLEEMKTRNEALDQRLLVMEERQSAVETPMGIGTDLPTIFRDAPEDGGWVIRTPNKEFNGDTCGIRFVQGMAIISKDVDGAKSKVEMLMSEYGYSAQPVSEADLNTFNRYINDNLASLMRNRSPDTEAKHPDVQPVFSGVVGGG